MEFLETDTLGNIILASEAGQAERRFEATARYLAHSLTFAAAVHYQRFTRGGSDTHTRVRLSFEWQIHDTSSLIDRG
jgi:hypothetical protein